MSNDNPPGAKQPLPDWYMQADMIAVFQKIRAGEFCEILGVGSAGKSNFVRQMVQPAVKRLYLQQYEPYFITVLLNPHLMINIDDDTTRAQTGQSWPGYELILSRMRRQLIELERSNLLPRSNEGIDIIEEIEDRIRLMFNRLPVIAHSGIRHLEDVVHEVLALGAEWHFVFIFDEIEEFVRLLPPEFFQSLRGLRDEFKGRVMYVTTSRIPLVDLAQYKIDKGGDPDTVMVMQGFTELFTGFTHYLQPFDERSAHEAIRRLEERNRVRLHELNRRRLVGATGSHPGLIRRAFLPTLYFPPDNANHNAYMQHLLADRGVARECENIYTSLADDERETLMALTRGRPPEEMTAGLRALIDKHLIRDKDGLYVHRLPILAGHLMDRANRERD